MSLFERLESELPQAVPGVEILADKHAARFQELTKRWSDVNRQTPGAIVLPTTEKEIQSIVKWCVGASMPFVTRGGGHSEWSTIDQSGIIIDLSHYRSIQIHANEKKAVLNGSVLTKPVALALAEEGFFTALGNGNTVGVIAYMLNGGVSLVNQVAGYGSDQILAARMVDARGELIEVSESSHPELLWALRGAGQFFGLVTELTIAIHPLSTLGNADGVIWSGTFVFPIDRAREVAAAMQRIMNNGERQTAGLMMVASPPPKNLPTLVIAARYTGNPDDAAAAYQLLHDLKPLVANGGPLPIQNASDGRADIGAYGGLKHFSVVGLPRFDEESFLKTVGIYTRMVQECPDAAASAFMTQWDANFPKGPPPDSANALHDTRFWQNNLIWHTDVANREKVVEYDQQCIAAMRDPDQSAWVDYQNATRAGPIEHRFRPAGKLERLRALKRKWDPTGVFSRQLLE